MHRTENAYDPFLPPPPKEKQLEYCSSDGFQIVLFQNIPQYF